MATPDRAAAMVAAAHQRHRDTRRQATETIRSLDADGQPITFAAVAAAAGISRAWLYRDAPIRAQIDRLRRSRTTAAPTRPAAERATTDSVRHQLDALRTLHAELRAENQQLRKALAYKLGQQRAGVTDTDDPL